MILFFSQNQTIWLSKPRVGSKLYKLKLPPPQDTNRKTTPTTKDIVLSCNITSFYKKFTNYKRPRDIGDTHTQALIQHRIMTGPPFHKLTKKNKSHRVQNEGK